ELPDHQQVVRVSVTSCENVTEASGGSDAMVVANEKPPVLPTPPVNEGQRPEGAELHVSGPCVSVKVNWWCSKVTGTFVAVPAVTPELRLVTVTVCVQVPTPLPLTL